ncbi:MAG: M48 family metallopeptidase [Treponema sp.]|nr:M48 family metallopeptidase [Treponema sp.]
MISVNLKNPFVLIFIVGTVFTFLINQFMEFVDFRARKKNGGKIPEVLKSVAGTEQIFTEEKLTKITSYENAKYKAWIPSSICKTLLLLALIIFGFYPWCFKVTCMITGEPGGFWSLFFCYIVFSVISGIPEAILSIPFSLYNEFSIEKRFGFSNMTLKLWIIDEIKSIFVGLIIFLLLGAAMAVAFTFFENSWWIIVSAVLIAFILLAQIIYPKFIAPLFNKFEPLPEGELRNKLEALLIKTGFKNDGLFVMDASKRSGHSNAYFSGFGKTKRVVLYDTLINQMTPDELVAVLGHELGHFKLKHILKNLILTFPLTVLGIFVLFKFSQIPSLYEAFGFEVPDEGLKWIQFIGITLLTTVWGALSELLSPLSNISSRRHEYQADKFSKDLCGTPDNLISGLVKLNSENLSELFPPAIYVWWNYSHPTLVQRIQALKS